MKRNYYRLLKTFLFASLIFLVGSKLTFKSSPSAAEETIENSLTQPNDWRLVKEQSGTAGNEVLIKNVGAGEFDVEKMTVWHYDKNNPQLVAKPGGRANIYAPDLLQNGGAWNLYYGGWDGTTDGFDRISLGISHRGLSETEWTGRFTIIDHGDYLHINDPSVVRLATNQWRMVYTAAKDLSSGCYRDWLGVATSTDGATWQSFSPTGKDEIIIQNAPADLQDMARPSLLKDGDEWKLYFDRGGPTDSCGPNLPYTYLATSTDAKNFFYQGQVLNRYSVEPDVEKFNDIYLLVTGWFENGIYGATSNDGRNFIDRGKLFGKSGQDYDRLYTTNPAIVRDGSRLLGVWYGAHTSRLDDAKIAAAYLQKEVVIERQGGNIQNAQAVGPDKLVLTLPGQEVRGVFKIYDADGTTLLFQSKELTIRSGDVYELVSNSAEKLALFPGRNKHNWLDIAGYTASSALSQISRDCSLDNAEIMATNNFGRWTSFISNFGGSDFNLKSGDNYYFNVSKSCQWRPFFTINPNQGYGNQQIFTTTIKPTSGGVENISQVHLRLDEIYPLPERTVSAFSAAVKKDPNGQYRFYGLRWLGGEDPNDGVNFNINDWRNYVWDVGGFLAGEDKKIFINRNRRSSTQRLQDSSKYINNSIAVLDVLSSQIYQDLTSGALVIKWAVEFFQPEFNQGAGLYGQAGSTDRKKLKIFLTSVDNQLNQAREVGEWIVGSPESVDLKLISQTKSGNKYIFKTSFNDSQGINQIESLTIWLDEIEPHSSRADMASYLTVKKNPDQSYAFYGLRYDSQSKKTCVESEIIQSDVSCYKNYQWDIGPISAGEDQRIYLNRGRTSSLVRQEDSFAVFHAQEAKIITDKANELVVEWVFEFLPEFGNRRLKIYLSGINSSGYNRWVERGELTINNPPVDHGQIVITPNQKYFQFSDASFYSMHGINRFNIHRQLTPEQMDGYLAKMAAYQMNYLRVFYLVTQGEAGLLDNLFDLAERHGVYINLNLFQGLSQEQAGSPPGFAQSKQRIDFAVDKWGGKKALFAWDLCNDCPSFTDGYPYREQWLDIVEPYLRQLDNNRHRVFLQLNTGRTFQDPENLHIIKNIDSLSVRSYSDDSLLVAQELSERIKRELVSRKPVYTGEFRRLNHGYRQVETETELGMLHGLWTGLAGGSAGSHPWTHNFAPELVDKFPAYPLLSEKEFTYFSALAKVFPLLNLPDFDFQRVEGQITSSVAVNITASFADNRLIAYLINPNKNGPIQPSLQINASFASGDYQALFIEPATGEIIETRQIILPAGSLLTTSFQQSLALLVMPPNFSMSR